MEYSNDNITLAKRVTSNKIVQKNELYPTPEKVRPLKKNVKEKCKLHRGRLLRAYCYIFWTIVDELNVFNCRVGTVFYELLALRFKVGARCDCRAAKVCSLGGDTLS